MKHQQDTGDDTEFWRAHKAESRERRARNRESGPGLLKAAGIVFVEKNGGAHLVVAGAWDFWPGTGHFHERAVSKHTYRRRGRGVRNLIDIIRQGMPK